MTDELLPIEGISRRDLLKRSAIVGGASAMVWAAPSITTLGGRAFGAAGTPPGEGWSAVAFVVTCGGLNYKVKWTRDDGGDDVGFSQEPMPPFCPGAPYDDALTGGATNAGGDLFTVNEPGGDGENTLIFTISRPEGSDCRILNGTNTSGLLSQAGACGPAGVVSEPDGQKITFNL